MTDGRKSLGWVTEEDSDQFAGPPLPTREEAIADFFRSHPSAVGCYVAEAFEVALPEVDPLAVVEQLNDEINETWCFDDGALGPTREQLGALQAQLTAVVHRWIFQHGLLRDRFGVGPICWVPRPVEPKEAAP